MSHSKNTATNVTDNANSQQMGHDGATLSSKCNPWDGWFAKLDSCKSLNDGWNGYTASAPSNAAIENAKNFLVTMKKGNLPPTRVAASAMGGIAITRKNGTRKGFVEFYNNGKIYWMLSDRRTDQMDVVELSNDESSFVTFIGQMREYLHSAGYNELNFLQ